MSDPLRLIVVDDEALARSLIRSYLEGNPRFEIVAECANGFEAADKVAELAPDLLLLDIQMPKMNGFELLEVLDPLPEIIFATAHDDYALDAFEVHAVDYLLKPFSQERLEAALARAAERLGRDPSRLGALTEYTRAAAAPLKRVLVRDQARVHVIPTDRVDYFEADDDYIKIHVTARDGSRVLRKKQRLAELEELLDSEIFVRVHRSYLLNIDRLSRLDTYAKDSRLAVLRDETRIPVSRSGYAKLRERL